MEKQEDGSYTQADFVVGHCENCDCELIDIDHRERRLMHGEAWDSYECSQCGHLTWV